MQMFEVALSRRMCCSRVCIAMRYACGGGGGGGGRVSRGSVERGEGLSEAVEPRGVQNTHRLALRVDAHADDPPRHLARHLRVRREEAGVRAAVPQRHPEALRRADGDVRAKLGGRRQRGEREEVGGDGELRARRRRLLGEGLVVDDGAVGRGVLHERAAHVVAEGEGGVVAGDDLDAEAGGARARDGERLRVDALVDEELGLLGVARVDHRHRLGGGGALVEERGVAELEARQVGHHRLEVHQRLEAPLRHLGLVRRVLRVPPRVLEDVPQDHVRRLRVVVPHPDERAVHLVRRDDPAQLGDRVALREARAVLAEVERAVEHDLRRHRLADELVDRRDADRVQHLLHVALTRAEVPRLEAVLRTERRVRRRRRGARTEPRRGARLQQSAHPAGAGELHR